VLALASRGRRHDDTVITAEERTELEQIAALLAKHRIKGIPIVRDGKVVGVVSRANLLQGLLSRERQQANGSASDDGIRMRISTELDKHSWGAGITNLQNGTVNLW
jgi:CBS-domain-containing membrane protein